VPLLGPETLIVGVGGGPPLLTTIGNAWVKLTDSPPRLILSTGW
jgi:hypothetical protein